MNILNIVCAGVGGQGVLFTSKVLSELAFQAGLDVKTNEVHGMAQRGGSVISQVRIGEKVYSPLIKKGDADFLIGMEKIETIRFGDYLKPDGVCITNDFEIMPPSVSSGIAKYPEKINDELSKYFSNVHIINAVSLAEDLGDSRVSNTILIGVLSGFLDFPEELWRKVFQRTVKEKAVELNWKAFMKGRTLLCSGMKK